MLRTKFKNQQIEQKIIRLNFFGFIQFQFRYQVIVEYVPIKTTEAILYHGQIARRLSSRSPKLCKTAQASSNPQFFFHCKLDLVKDDQHQYSLSSATEI